MDPEVLQKINEAMSSLSATMSNIDEILSRVNTKFLRGAAAIGEGADKVTESTEAMGSAAEKTAGQQDTLSTSIQGTAKASDSYVESAKMAVAGGNDISKSVEVAGTAIAFLSLKIMGASQVMRDWASMNTLGNKSAHATAKSLAALEEAAKNFPFLGPLLGKAFEPLKKAADEIAYVREAENNLLAMRARHGGFSGRDRGQTADRAGFVEDLDAEMTKFMGMNTEVANAVNLSSVEVQKYAAEIMKLPRLYDQTIKLGGETGTSMTGLEAAIRMTRGTTGDFNDAVRSLSFQFKEFGSYEGADELLTRTYKLSQQLGVSFKDLETPIMNISRRFAMFGDNTKAVINLTGGLTKALTNAGMGIRPATEIVEKMVGGIADLNVAQRAFLSAQTGGSGGLRGAFEIEQLMREGNMDEVYQRMQEALQKQFGGRIVTLEEAAQDDASASIRMRQQAMLTQGPFGDIAGGEKGASRLLDAMAAGNISDFTRDTTSDAVGEAMKVDDAIQKRQLNQLQEITNNTRYMADMGIIKVASGVRRTFGGESPEAAAHAETVTSKSRERAMGYQSDDYTYRGPAHEMVAATKRTSESVRGVVTASTASAKRRAGLREAQTEAAAQEPTRAAPTVTAPTTTTPSKPVEPTAPSTTGAPGVAQGPGLVRFDPAEITITVQDPTGKVLGTARSRASQASGGGTPTAIAGQEE